MESCCTCATILSATPQYSAEKPLPEHRRVACCSRVICGKCIHINKRFASYCPYCQISTVPSPLPQGLKDPPSYLSVLPTSSKTAEQATIPPPYSATSSALPLPDIDNEKAALVAADEKDVAEDTLHFLNHDYDTIASLSIRYNVPAMVLRQANKITSDHLLQGRRTVLIPGEYYKGGVSLSPRPVEGEEEERRKSKIRRFMTSCKVSDYDIAVLYLEQSGYDLGAATEAFVGDETWERNNPNQMPRSGKVKERRSRGPFWRGL